MKVAVVLLFCVSLAFADILSEFGDLLTRIRQPVVTQVVDPATTVAVDPVVVEQQQITPLYSDYYYPTTQVVYVDPHVHARPNVIHVVC